MNYRITYLLTYLPADTKLSSERIPSRRCLQVSDSHGWIHIFFFSQQIVVYIEVICVLHIYSSSWHAEYAVAAS